MPDYSDLTYSLAGLGRRADPYDARRKYGMQMYQAGSDSSPIQSPWQGANRLAQALVGGWMTGQANSEESAKDKERSTALAAAMAEPDPQKRIGLLAAYDPSAGAHAAGQLAVAQATQESQDKRLQNSPSLGGSFGMVPQPQGGAGNAIAGIESAGQPNGGYGAVGPVANGQGNRALGKYQVLDSNVGPWTKEVLGQEMTPEQFLANPQAQEAVFKTKFGQYVQQSGGDQQKAAQMWFAGPGGANNPNARDVNGMTVANYGKQFVANGGAGPQGAPPPQGQPQPQVAQAPQPYGGPQGDMVAPGMPPQPTGQGVRGPTVGAPAVPEVPRPQPTPQQIQQYDQRLKAGEFGMNPAEARSKARAALDADLDRQWNVNRDQAKMGFELQAGDYRANRNQDLQQPQNNAQNESKMREQFDQLQSVKDYRKANTVFRSAVDASKVNSAAADLNMVYAFATLMDPGSVVRDSETQMVTATQNASDRVKAMVATVSGGARLSPEARSSLLNEMASRYQAYKTAHDDLSKSFGGIAERTPGVNPQNVAVPYPEVPYERPAVPQMPGSGAPPPPPGYKVMK